MPDLRTPMAPILPSQAFSFGLIREHWENAQVRLPKQLGMFVLFSKRTA